MGAELQKQKKVKIHFVIQKHIDFGQAIYVVGNIAGLGNWKVENSCKLCWSKVLFLSRRMTFGLALLLSTRRNKKNISSSSM